MTTFFTVPHVVELKITFKFVAGKTCAAVTNPFLPFNFALNPTDPLV